VQSIGAQAYMAVANELMARERPRTQPTAGTNETPQPAREMTA